MHGIQGLECLAFLQSGPQAGQSQNLIVLHCCVSTGACIQLNAAMACSCGLAWDNKAGFCVYVPDHQRLQAHQDQTKQTRTLAARMQCSQQVHTACKMRLSKACLRLQQQCHSHKQPKRIGNVQLAIAHCSHGRLLHTCEFTLPTLAASWWCCQLSMAGL